MKRYGWLFFAALSISGPVWAGENPAVVDALSEYMDFSDYGSSLIMPQQIPA